MKRVWERQWRPHGGEDGGEVEGIAAVKGSGRYKGSREGEERLHSEIAVELGK